MPRQRKLTDSEEAELLVRFELGKMNGIKELCSAYNIGRSTLQAVIKRAKSRLKQGTPSVDIHST